MNKFILSMLLLGTLFSCGEEVLTQNTLSTSFNASDVEAFEVSQCAQSHLEKPPVDILYVVDNSKSTSSEQFQNIKSQIQNTIYNISNEFDYHVYVAPLHGISGESISGYPLVISDPSSISNIATVNIVSPESLSIFSEAQGSNVEKGFSRVKSLVDGNRTNGIFRDNTNLLVILISNGDDNSSTTQVINGEEFTDESIYNSSKQDMYNFTKKSGQGFAEYFRFISLAPESKCDDQYKIGTDYKKMSRDVYNYMGYTDSATQDFFDLCQGNFSEVFTAVNNSIHQVIVGHKYDHWKISGAQSAEIQEDDITVKKVLSNGSEVEIAPDKTNGFEYLGSQTDQNTRYEPTEGEPASGLLIKLYGDARVSYPECIVAKTRTPTEYYGYIAIPREPQVGSLNITIRGKSYSKSTTNGWSYIGWHDIKNIKVPGPTNAAVTPVLNKSGYFIQLHGDAIMTNGDSLSVTYKPAAL